jgi:hypothetical protein
VWVRPVTEAGQRPLRQLTPSTSQRSPRCHPLNLYVGSGVGAVLQRKCRLQTPARDWCAIDGVAGSRGDRVAGTHPARVGDWRVGRTERTILTTDERVARGMVAWQPRLPNKEMKLTSVEHNGRSQLISSVRRTRRAT